MEFNIWKPLLAEFNTHGLLGSRNFPSSRAIPWNRMREKILNDPHIPMFRKNNPGMQPAEPLSVTEQAEAVVDWLETRDFNLAKVEKMGAKDGLNIHKQWLNRLLEPWITVTGLVTATDWDNFFNLRTELNDSCFPMAQDEFYFMSVCMKKALDESVPATLKPGELHIPYIKNKRDVLDALSWGLQSDFRYSNDEVLMMVSAGRCATVSYDNLGQGVDAQKDYSRAVGQLRPFGHMSVFQHQAICLPEKIDVSGSALYGVDEVPSKMQFSGQLRGWTQFRKTLPGETCWVSPNADRELALTMPELWTS